MIRRVPADDEHDCPFLLGDVYQRKLRGIDGRPSFRVVAVPTRQRLAAVTHRDAIMEGFLGRRALERFRLDWVRRHDRWSRTHRTASDKQVLERWRTRHAGRDCWVLMIALVEPPRLLAPQRDILAAVAHRGTLQQKGRVLGDGDEYTSGVTIDREAEAVDEATLTRLVAARLEARMVSETSRRQRRAMRRRRLFEGEQESA